MDRSELYSIIDNAARIVPPGAVEMSATDLQEWLNIVADSPKAFKDTKKACRAAAKVVHSMISGMYEMPNHQPADADDSFPLAGHGDDEPAQPEEPTMSATEAPELEAPAEPAKKEKKPRKSRATGKERTQAAVKPLSIIKAPKGTVREVPLADLVREKSLQQRTQLFDEATVEGYKELYEEGGIDALPPIEAIEIHKSEAEALGFPGTILIYNGFQRSEARNRVKGADTIKVSVAKGTYADARLLSLSANANAPLARTFADIRRALSNLLEDDAEGGMLETVLKAGVGNGGANRAIAAAVGCSKGLVSRVLNAMGKTTRGDKVVNLPAPKPTGDAGPVHRPEGDPNPRQESMEAIEKKASAAILLEMTKLAASLQRRYQALLVRPDTKALFVEKAREHGVAVKKDRNHGKMEQGEATESTVTEYWPAVDTLIAMLDDLAAAHADQQTKPTT